MQNLILIFLKLLRCMKLLRYNTAPYGANTYTRVHILHLLNLGFKFSPIFHLSLQNLIFFFLLSFLESIHPLIVISFI